MTDPTPPNDPIDASPMSELRMRALSDPPGSFGLPSDGDAPWAVVMEMGYGDVHVSLVSLSDGNASLYFSTGGGVIGGFAHESVRNAAKGFVAASGAFVARLAPAREFPPPKDGRTCFYIRRGFETLGAEASESELAEGKHPLSALFYAGQDVITALRETTEAM